MKHEIRMDFRIMDFEGSPDEITRMVGLEPTRTWRKGQLIDTRTAPKHKENGWELTSGLPNEESFENHLKSIFEKLKSHKNELKSVCEKYYCELSIALYLNEDSEESLPGIHFEKEQISLLSELSTEIDLDLYIVGV